MTLEVSLWSWGLSVTIGGIGFAVEILELCVSTGSNQFWLVQTSYE